MTIIVYEFIVDFTMDMNIYNSYFLPLIEHKRPLQFIVNLNYK
jgi:hypothetical protein